MSREADSPSTGPEGRGDTAYPSGTPPLPTRGAQREGGLPPAAAADDGPRTETTLTTRIRINIPGSRPIPPVVVRTPVDGAGGATGEEAAEPAVAGAQSAVASVGGGGGPHPAGPGGSSGPTGSSGPSGSSGSSGNEKASDWFAPRKPSAPQPAVPPAPPAGPAGPSGPPPVRDSVPPPPFGAEPADDEPRDAAPPFGMPQDTPPADDPSTMQMPAVRTDGHGFAAGNPANASPVRPTPPGGPAPVGPPPGVPAGPTAGPTTGSFNLAPPAAPAGMPPASGGPAGPPAMPPVAPLGAGAPPAPSPFAAEAQAPGFMPPPAAPAQGLGGAPGQGAPADPYAYVYDGDDGDDRTERRGPNRRKLAVLAGGTVLGLLAAAYGVGLVLNHADVPNGTTVLGVDIGGSTRDEAVAKLDESLGDRLSAPLKLRVGDAEEQLKPETAGLEMDTAATVRAATGSDYNPVSVIGSLFGGSRVIEPVMSDDQDKLRAALESLAASTGGGRATDGMIKFEAGKAVRIEGKPSKGLDVDKSMALVQDAFDARAAGGPDQVVELPVTTQEPKVTDAEFERALGAEAKLFMSANVKVKAGGQEIEFSPQRSLPKFLALVPSPEGKLVPYIDLKALKATYGGFFDGMVVERGDGSKTAVKPTDVAQAIMAALQQSDPAKRVGVIETA
ncbi:hypothetical protein AB0M28_33300 [Streptomyces sp. NPDC051940]|uniref:hypothetical protein n=1 Tax=Streptomyces sp. NPDC051940 TaxID=3155675 RepID=UPI00341BC06B